MKSFSTAAFVAALALVVPSAVAVDSFWVSEYYTDSTCTTLGMTMIETATEKGYADEASSASACATFVGVYNGCTDNTGVLGGYNKYSCAASTAAAVPGGTITSTEYSDGSCATENQVYAYEKDVCFLYGLGLYAKFSCGYEMSLCPTSECIDDDCISSSGSGGTCEANDDDGDDDDDNYGSSILAGCSSDDVCFSGDDTLLLESGKAKRLSEVALGDKVQTADANGVLSFSEVVALPHAANNKLASFVNVATASGKSVKATKMHLLQQCDGSLAYAGSLAAGDCLRTVDGDEAVTAVSMTKAEGIYTAVTTNEFLVVNGIVASPFAVTHGLTNAYYNAHRFVAKVFPSALKSPLVLAANAFLGGAFLSAGGSK